MGWCVVVVWWWCFVIVVPLQVIQLYFTLPWIVAMQYRIVLYCKGTYMWWWCGGGGVVVVFSDYNTTLV